MKKIRNNILKIIGIALYFAILYFAYTRMQIERLTGDINVFAGIFLIFGILMIEKSYKNEKEVDAITAIELIVLAFYSLSLIYVTKIIKIEFGLYLLYSGVIISIYYIIKGIVSYTKEKRAELKKLSDISEIIKEEPLKKEATKKNRKEETKAKEQKKTNSKESKEILKENSVKKKKDKKKSTTKKKKNVKSQNKN